MNLPKRNSADGRCYWIKPEVQEELQPLFDQCIQDAIDGKITRLDDSHWPPVVVSSQGAPFEVWQLLRAWTEIQRAETLDAEKAIAFSENLRRQSRRKRPSPSAKTCAARAGGVKLTTIYLIC